MKARGFIYRARKGLLGRTQWHGRIRALDTLGRPGRILFVSSEGYNNKSELIAAFRLVNPDLEILHDGKVVI